MSILTTFPGRYGDILWALPSVRAISERAGEPVDLAIAGEFKSILPLLRLQPYLHRVEALDEWTLTPPNEWRAPIEAVETAMGLDWDELRDLGYRGWPDCPLPYAIAAQAKVKVDLADLHRPWITLPPLPQNWDTSCLPCGFTEAWFELKVGLVELLTERFEYRQETNEDGFSLMPIAAGGRWVERYGRKIRPSYTWLEAAEFLTASPWFFGDCSALHVLAIATGVQQVLLMEPMEARHNPIFYPLGKTGRVKLIVGNDDKPTFDVGHCAEEILAAKARLEAK